MRITDLLQKEAILLNAKVGSKRETIDLLVSLHEKAGNIKDTQKYRQGILDREAGGTTAIGDGTQRATRSGGRALPQLPCRAAWITNRWTASRQTWYS